MSRLEKLAEAVRTISPQAEFTFRGVPDREDLWVCLVSVGGLIIIDTAAGSVEDVLNEVIRKIDRMSHRLLAAVSTKENIPPSSG
jgi:hypothetical protein